MDFGISANIVTSYHKASGVIEVCTTDTDLINELNSIIISQITTGLEVERFVGLDLTQINISEAVKRGLVEEYNVQLLEDNLPLENAPINWHSCA
tara:strand:- start:6396 stop:6680 length:285 start_codon:yes stop_codon:yes gene_type:complete